MFFVFLICYCPLDSFLFHLLLHFLILIFFVFSLILFVSSYVSLFGFLVISGFCALTMFVIFLKFKEKLKITNSCTATDSSYPWMISSFLLSNLSNFFLGHSFLVKPFFLYRLYICIVVIYWITFHFLKSVFI